MNSMYGAFVSIDYLAHTLFDIAFCVVIYLQYRYVIRTGRTEHLRWIYPGVLSCGITMTYRIILNVHHFLGVRLNGGEWMSLYIWHDLGDASSIIGSIIFLKMMLAGKIIVIAPVHSAATDPEAWPPPPSPSQDA